MSDLESGDFEEDGRDAGSDEEGAGVGFVSETLDEVDQGDDSNLQNGDFAGGGGNNAHIEVFFEEYDSWRPATVIGNDEDGLVIVEYVLLVWTVAHRIRKSAVNIALAYDGCCICCDFQLVGWCVVLQVRRRGGGPVGGPTHQRRGGWQMGWARIY